MTTVLECTCINIHINTCINIQTPKQSDNGSTTVPYITLLKLRIKNGGTNRYNIMVEYISMTATENNNFAVVKGSRSVP